MKYFTWIAAVALVGSAAACTDDGNYSGGSQYGYNSGDRNRDGIADNRQNVRNHPRADADGDGVPNGRDAAPRNPFFR